MSERWRRTARHLKREVYALYFAVRDPRVAWYAKALAACVVAYAFSPIDLIPDPIPILGYLDDLVLIPLGVLVVRALIPPAVLEDCRVMAGQLDAKPRNWVAAGIIMAMWLLLAALASYWLLRWLINHPFGTEVLSVQLADSAGRVCGGMLEFSPLVGLLE